jgi:hypothetical protein
MNGNNGKRQSLVSPQRKSRSLPLRSSGISISIIMPAVKEENNIKIYDDFSDMNTVRYSMLQEAIIS